MNQGIDILNKKIESLDRDELENKKIASAKIATLIEKTEIDIKQLLKELHVSKGDTKVVKKIKHEFISIAVAFDGQKINKVINNKYDEKIDYILTEKKLYKT